MATAARTLPPPVPLLPLSGPEMEAHMRTYLYLAVWLHALRHLDVFEARLAACLPELAITDRAVILWQLKLGGHLLDPTAAACGPFH